MSRWERIYFTCWAVAFLAAMVYILIGAARGREDDRRCRALGFDRADQYLSLRADCVREIRQPLTAKDLPDD